jgi:predicted dehydrogenase
MLETLSEGCFVPELKIGVVGGGHIVKHRHLPIYKKIRDAEVSAICDKQESIAKSVASRFGVGRYYKDFSEMLSKEELDVVDICTPPQTHVSLATEAMEAGCHVLVEKPLAMNVNDVNKMFKVSEKKHVKLCVVHQNLFNPAVQKARSLVDSGIVGDLISVDVGTFVRRDNYMCLNGKHWCHALPGGLFFEVLPHPVYLLQSFLKNAVPICVVAKKLSDFQWMKADEVKVLMEAENGVGLIVASCNSPFHGDTLNILGTKLGLQVDLWGRSVIKYKPRTENPYSVGKGNLSIASQFLTLIGTTVSNSFTMAFGGVKVSAHYFFLREFIRSIQSDLKLPVSEEEARENVRIVESICERIDDSVSNA